MNTYLSYIMCTIYKYIQSNIGIIIDTNRYKIQKYINGNNRK